MPTNPYLGLMLAANAHAKTHGAQTPVLSPEDATLLGGNPSVDVAALHRAGIRIIPWTTNDPGTMRTLIALRVDGLITDRPDLLQTVLRREADACPADAPYFTAFDIAGHRGARGLRPENTLPAFEAGLDHLVTTLETDTGVTADRVSLISHDQFLNPHSCRRVDGTSYTLENRVYIRDLTLAEAQSDFLCDKLLARFPEQTNDPVLSPVAVAFAAHETLLNPYAPTHVQQLFRFTHFYADYYRTGPGRSHPEAEARAVNATHVRFNIETKILPFPNDPQGRSVTSLLIPNPEADPTTNHTVDPQTFVTTLCGTIQRNHMEHRAEVQSFDFRTLRLIEQQYPKIPTYYLTEGPESLSTPLLPPSLRQP